MSHLAYVVSARLSSMDCNACKIVFQIYGNTILN